MEANKKRLFFGFEVSGPWGHEPGGHLLKEEDRHTTVAFLGFKDFEALKKKLYEIPLPSWKIGLVATATSTLFLPPRDPKCVCLELEFQEFSQPFLSYHKELISYLIQENFLNETEIKFSFLPHVTLCRSPFIKKEWVDHFKKIPLSIGDLHLYESLGNSRYHKVWTFPIPSPFEELSHTADIAFKVRGTSLQTIALHAFYALASKAPSLLNYDFDLQELHSLTDVIASLNKSIAWLDIEEGSSLKAVSYHGNIVNDEWEMIVDV